jgi:hypothetical protein
MMDDSARADLKMMSDAQMMIYSGNGNAKTMQYGYHIIVYTPIYNDISRQRLEHYIESSAFAYYTPLLPPLLLPLLLLPRLPLHHYSAPPPPPNEQKRQHSPTETSKLGWG